MSPFWILLELRAREVASGGNWNFKRAKLQSNHHHQKAALSFFTGHVTHPQTGPIIIHCAAASAQFKVIQSPKQPSRGMSDGS